MSSLGIHSRLRRLEGPGGRLFLLALDHGLPAGPLPGLEEPRRLLGTLARAPLTGCILTPGLAPRVARDLPPHRGLVVHLSAGTLLGARPTSKVLAAAPERALALGADAVSVQVHFGDPAEDRMLSEAGDVTDRAGALGLPALVMAYPPGTTAGKVPDTGDVAHAARAAAELRAQVVQVPYTGSEDTFREVVRGCPVPVIVSGGPRPLSTDLWLATLDDALRAGAAGVAAGRILFQDPDPASLAGRIGRLLFAAPLSAPLGG